MEISEAAERTAKDIKNLILNSWDIDADDVALGAAVLLVHRGINEAIEADREQHKIKTSDLAAINAQQGKEIERLRVLLLPSRRTVQSTVRQ